MSLLTALLLATSTYAAPLDLPKTAHVRMTVVLTREDPPADKPANTTTVYDKTIEATNDGYRVTLQRVSVSPPPEAAPGKWEPVQAALDGLSSRATAYDADENLAPRAFGDWAGNLAEIRKGLTSVTDSDKDAERVVDGVLAKFQKMSPTEVVDFMFKDDGLLTIPVNVELRPGQPRIDDDVLPNPFGGPSIKKNGALALERIDEARGVAILRWSKSIDPKSLRESMAQAFDAMAAKFGAEIDTPEIRARFENMRLERTSDCRYEIDLKSGLPVRADCDFKTLSEDPMTGETSGRREHRVITQTLKN